jgi:cytochrome P450
VIQESMRLYPPIWAVTREAVKDDEIGGYHIPAKSMIALSPYLMHRHPDHWESPEAFDPERFAEGAEAPNRYVYFPFGGGQRVCIGNHFAMMEAQVILAMIVRRFRFSLVPGQNVVPEPFITLKPSGELNMTLQKRS